jgi:hypothetical protein
VCILFFFESESTASPKTLTPPGINFMDLLQPSMDTSRRLQVVYHTGCGPLRLYVGFEMIQPTEGLSQILPPSKPSRKNTPSICRHHLANVCHMQEMCKELHTIQEVSISMMHAFDVDCFCAQCFRINGTRRSLLQCMFHNAQCHLPSAICHLPSACSSVLSNATPHAVPFFVQIQRASKNG